MRVVHYKNSRSKTPSTATSSYVREALEKQAASRPAKTPPKLMPVTPTLPRIPKPHKHRRRAVKGV